MAPHAEHQIIESTAPASARGRAPEVKADRLRAVRHSRRLTRVGLGVRLCLWIVASLGFAAPSFAQQTVGLFENAAGAYDGFTLFSNLQYPELYLIDNDGQKVHSWSTTYVTGNSAYLLDDGSVMRAVDPGGNTTFVAGGDGGMVQHLDWDGTVLWEYLYSDTTVRHHHDISVLPNGNVLILAWEGKSNAEAIAAGRDPSTMATGVLWPEHIVEVEPVGLNGGNIVWEWHLWDHLIQDFDGTKANFGVVADHPELIDVNYRANTSADWIHMNSIDYNPDLDQIVMSSPRFNEFWIIDHSTTTAEAAGHTGGNRGKGGDILYRWGNPEAYGRGTSVDKKLFGQHDVSWIPPGLDGAGNILLYNNGPGRTPTVHSTVDEYVTPVDMNGDYPALGVGQTHGPAGPVWSYQDVVPANFFSGGLSSAQRLPNGNTLIAEGVKGNIFEIDDLGNRVWRYVNPVGLTGPVTQGDPISGNNTFRAKRYPRTSPAFVGKDVTPKGTVELSPPVPGLSAVARLILLGALVIPPIVVQRRRR